MPLDRQVLHIHIFGETIEILEWGGVGVEMKVNRKKAAVKVKLESTIRVLVQRQKRMNYF